ncbi:unnamed protein product, partial [marine sediment metagenome]
MKGKSLSLGDNTKVRIAKDIRKLQRLIKEAEKHLVEGHSPVLYDYVSYELDRMEDPIKEATQTVDDSIMTSVNDMENYYTDAERVALETVTPWGAEAQLIMKTAEERNFGWVSDVETHALEYVFRGEDTLNDEVIH